MGSASQMRRVSTTWSAQFERIAVLKPVVRNFLLIAVLNLLLEHAVAVADAAAVGRISQGCQGIQEAGGKTAQTAVAQCRIRLLVLNHVQVKSQLIQSLPDFLLHAHIDDIIAQGAAHQEFHGEIIKSLGILPVHLLLGRNPVIHDHLVDGVAHSLEHLLGRCLLEGLAELALDILNNRFLKLCLAELRHIASCY